MNYIFFDYNDDTNEEYNIQGEDYRELLRVCFRYSEMCSVWFSPHIHWVEKLKPYEISVDPDRFEYAPPYGHEDEDKGDIIIQLHFYRNCPELHQLLVDYTYDIWNGWDYEQPAFLHFYRADGTCFFMSDTHDGKCAFYPRVGEDISSVVSKAHWHCESELRPGAIPSPRPDNYRPLEKKN